MANPVVKAIAAQGLQFYDTLVGQQKLAFGENQDALNLLSKAWAPVLTSGAVPYGFSPQLDQLLQANVMDTGAQAEKNAIDATALRQQQETGGANVMPTGAQEQINASILATGQQKIAEGLQKEKLAGYAQGLENLEGGTKAELGIADATNPTRAGEAAVAAGNMAEKAGSDQFQENLATGPMAIASGVIGDISKGASAIESIGNVGSMFSNSMSGGGAPSPAAQADAWYNGGDPIS